MNAFVVVCVQVKMDKSPAFKNLIEKVATVDKSMKDYKNILLNLTAAQERLEFMEHELQQCISLATLSAVLDVGQGLKTVEVATKQHEYFLLELLDHNGYAGPGSKEPFSTNSFLGDPCASAGLHHASGAYASTTKKLASTAGIHKISSSTQGYYAGSSGKHFSISLTDYCLFHAKTEESYHAYQPKLSKDCVLTVSRAMLIDSGES
jgi:hypothetical protein